MAHHSLKGQLLLDNGTLGGSFFHRTVVLICEHDAEGAFGLILNRPTPNKVGDAIVADLPDTLKAMTLFLGGPVQPPGHELSLHRHLHSRGQCHPQR